MGYPNFGKVKTIVLVADSTGSVTEEVYFKKYGIKLSDIFEVKDGIVVVKDPNAEYFIWKDDNGLSQVGRKLLPVIKDDYNDGCILGTDIAAEIVGDGIKLHATFGLNVKYADGHFNASYYEY